MMTKWFNIKDKVPDNEREFVIIYSRESTTVDKRGDYLLGRYVKDSDDEYVWETMIGTINIGWYPYWTHLPNPPKVDKYNSDNNIK